MVANYIPLFRPTIQSDTSPSARQKLLTHEIESSYQILFTEVPQRKTYPKNHSPKNTRTHRCDTMAEPPPEPSAAAPTPTPTRNIFAIPSPLRRLFNHFPLRTTPSNPLPARCAVAGPGDTPILFVFTDEEGARIGSPSFNPACLKWQVSIFPLLTAVS